MDIFNKALLLSHLKDLPQPARAAFAASIATRLMPTCIQTMGEDSLKSQHALNALWSYLLSQDAGNFDCQQQLDTVMAQLMNGDCERAGLLRIYAENAIQAVVYALRTTLNDDPQEPIWAAQVMIESVGQHISVVDKLSALKGPKLAEVIFNHPMMKVEYSRQFQDIEQLKNWNVETCLIMKERAEQNPALPENLESSRIYFAERGKRKS